jgi:hypothetical protein
MREVRAQHPLVPRRLVHELLLALPITVSPPRGQRLNALALAIEHQPTQIHATPPALLRRSKRTGEHRLGKSLQPATHPRQLLL